MEFGLLKEVNKTNDHCQKHDKSMVMLRGMEPFCTECQKEKLAEAEQTQVDDSFQKHWKRRTVEVLEKDSIIGDPTLWYAEFGNYKTDNKETQLALEKSRIAAGQYLDGLNRLNVLKREIKMAKQKYGGNSDQVKELSASLRVLDRQTSFNVIYTGVPGVGKSHLAMSILKAINANAKPYVSCLFVSIADVMRLIRDSFSNPKSIYTEENMVRLLSEVDLLVLDDLGSESTFQSKNNEASEYNQKVLFPVLNARSRTIITTNLDSNSLELIYNSKIVSRIYKGVDGNVIKFTQATKDKRSKIQF